MALGDYTTTDAYKASRAIPDGLDDVEIARVITVASRMIDNYCGRTFYQDASATTRHFRPPNGDTLIVDDISTTTGLVVVDFNTTLTIDVDFGLFPADGVTNAGEAGPYYMLTKFYGVPWFQVNKGATVAVTARWGWAATPPAITDACMALCSDLLQARNNSFGVVGLDTGAGMRVRMNTLVQTTLAPYRRESAPAFGFA